jgi:hypothetical protein
MDGNGFDRLTREIARRGSRRAFLKGLFALGGGAAVVVAVQYDRAESRQSWSTYMCLPNGSGGYTVRLVPTSAVPYYKAQGGVVAGPGQTCPTCQPTYVSCSGGCFRCCANTDCPSGQLCVGNVCTLPTPTNTPTSTPTATPITPTSTATHTSTPTPVTPTSTATYTSTPTPITPTSTATYTSTPTPVTPTSTATYTSTPLPE